MLKKGGIGEGYSVAFDPLDGSSIVDTNFTVGTVFGVWPGSKLKGIKGSDMVTETTLLLPLFIDWTSRPPLALPSMGRERCSA